MAKTLERCGQQEFIRDAIDLIVGTARCTSCRKILTLTESGKLPTHGQMVS